MLYFYFMYLRSISDPSSEGAVSAFTSSVVISDDRGESPPPPRDFPFVSGRNDTTPTDATPIAKQTNLITSSLADLLIKQGAVLLSTLLLLSSRHVRIDHFSVVDWIVFTLLNYFTKNVILYYYEENS
jgi:hypothetical protein